MTAKLLTSVAASALLLTACTRQEVAQAPVSAEPLDGAATVCDVTPTPLPVGAPATVQMKVRNDGGWCAVRIADKEGTPFSFPLMRQRPANGQVSVNKVNGNSRIEYTPKGGFSGTDVFTVALVPKDQSADVLVHVSATVEPDPNRPAPTVTAPAPSSPQRGRAPQRANTRRPATR